MPIFSKRTLVGFLSTLIVAAPVFAQDSNTSNPLPKVSQEWRFEPDTDAPIKVVTLRKNGRWIYQGESVKNGTCVLVGKRDHTTVLNSIRRFVDSYLTDAEKEIAEIMEIELVRYCYWKMLLRGFKNDHASH
jgi:hypothetical protein